jgi:uncharacterized protein YbjT (DUF2867 family)
MQRYQKTLIAGASGKTGQALLPLLHRAKLSAKLLTSKPQNKKNLEAFGEVMVADLMKPQDAQRAIEGTDAVLCTVGAGSSPTSLLFGGSMVDSTGTINLINAAKQSGCKHFTLVTSIGVGDSSNDIPTGLKLIIGRVLTAKNEAEEALRKSGLSYTILRPGGLSDNVATLDVLVGQGGGQVTGMIPRADVARLMLASLFTEDAKNKTFELVSRSGLRGNLGRLTTVQWAFPWEVA